MFAKVIVLAAVAIVCANGKPLVAAPLVAAAPFAVTAQSSQYIARNYNGIAAAYTAPFAAAYTAASIAAPVDAAYTAAYSAPVAAAAAYTAPIAAAYNAAPLAAAYTASPYYPYVL
ncbi:pupal cuticle protein C1B-like [Toxorhynchites rutilus septentrionalis]|uniref:pupal cuticle protein C1B-like n=1 Tax=Toxorhynchites rutilus septentrionalis TaxID=329112 RepID=UPI002479262E|nr:pupal cuticle protein C1B-like [Toxorhynchites rutilus septentrionalis]